MKVNQWFKLAVLAFAGIVLSSVSLSILGTSSGTGATTSAIATQNDPNSHSAHGQAAGQDTSAGTGNMSGMSGMTGMTDQTGQMNMNQYDQMNQMGQMNTVTPEQIAEMQWKIWTMQARLNALRASTAQYYGANYGYGYNQNYVPYGMQPGYGMANFGMNN
ncbi:MAG TPA: hypothetical protein VHS59_08625, partial [Bacillota bacterium]|nr:hypothetical protein [Bacillota bacterium]